MSIFKQIRDAMFESTEETAQKTTQPTPLTPPGGNFGQSVSYPNNVVLPMSVFPSPATLVTLDTEKLNELRQKVHPTSGPLVLFITTLQSLQQYIPDEVSRFRAVANTLQAQNITVEQVVADINGVLTQIENNRVAAETAKNRKIEVEVTARENRVTEIGQMIEAKQAQIASLMEERNQVFNEAQTQKTNIDTKWSMWENVRQTLVAEYADSLRKLTSYFQTGGTK